MSEPVYDPLIDRVPLLLQFDGSMVDSSPVGHVMTASANAVLDTTRQRFGAGCLHINAEAGRLETPASTALAVGGAVPWTLEMSVRFPGVVPWTSIFALGTSSTVSPNESMVFLGTNAGQLRTHVHGVHGGLFSAALSVDTWHQFMVRSMPREAGGWVKEVWLDGALLWEHTTASAPASMLSTGNNWGKWYFGYAPNTVSNAPGGPCLIDSVRLTNNYARSYAEQTDVFGTVAPPTFWPGAGQAWPGGAVAI